MKTKELKKITTAAICGLFCEGCGLYIASQGDEKRLAKIGEQYKMSAEEVRCDGCGSQKLGPYCRTCKIRPCAKNKGVSFCSECDEFPCQLINDFLSQPLPAHRLELLASLKRIKDAGYDKWYEEMIKHYACRQCNTINSAYHIACRNCGNTPGNNYIEKHLEEIKRINAPLQKN
jgi:hypothetical protein